MSVVATEFQLGFIGAGNMARSLIGGLLATGFAAEHITVADPSSACTEAAQAMGVKVANNNDAVVAVADVIILAVKPQVMAQVLTPLARVLEQHQPLLISIAAGVSSASLQRWAGNSLPIVRCMPNTPSLLREGASALFATTSVNAKQKSMAENIMQAVGLSVWVGEEAQLDAVTAVSGSGPAYFFLLMELMQQAGERLGLDTSSAKQLTIQTALGAAKMAQQSDEDIAQLRAKVTSPNGTTQAAIESFIEQDIAATVNTALDAAHQRSISLAKEMDSD